MSQITHSFNGGEPFPVSDAPPAPPPPASPAPAAPKPSTWDRLSTLWTRKRGDALSRAKKTFLAIERDKKTLDDRALEAFALDLREAGIGETQLSEWRGMLGRLAAAREATLRIPAAREAMAATQKRLADIELMQLDLQAQHARALEETRTATQGFHNSSAPIDGAAGVVDRLREIFGGESFD